MDKTKIEPGHRRDRFGWNVRALVSMKPGPSARLASTLAANKRQVRRPCWQYQRRDMAECHSVPTICPVSKQNLAVLSFDQRHSAHTFPISLVPRRPRSDSERRNSSQNTWASLGWMAMPNTSRRPSVLTATATMAATLTIRPERRTLM